MEDHIKHFIDTFSFGALVATLAGWLPNMAAIVTIIWTMIRIYETKTVQYWLKGKDRRSTSEHSEKRNKDESQ